jgi:hypothetical protein
MMKISNMNSKRFMITFLCLRWIKATSGLGWPPSNALGSLTIMIGAAGDLFPENRSKVKW